METTVINREELRAKMRDLGVSQGRLARAALIPQPEISMILAGRGYLGAKRSARLLDALRRLAVEIAERKAAEAAAAQSQTSGEQTPAKKPTANIRRL